MRIPRLYFADLCRRSSYYVLITECIPFAPRGPCVATHSLTYVHIQVHPIRATRSVRTPLLSCVHTYAHLQEHPICVTRSQTWIALTSPGPSVALMLTIPGPHVIIVWQGRQRPDTFSTGVSSGPVSSCPNPASIKTTGSQTAISTTMLSSERSRAWRQRISAGSSMPYSARRPPSPAFRSQTRDLGVR